MLSINNDLHWSPEEKDGGGVAEGQLTEEVRKALLRRTKRRLLTGLDWTISLTVLAPLCILYWRGLWQLLDIYVVIDDTLIAHPSGYVSLAVGYLLTFLCNATQLPASHVICDRRRNGLLRVFVSRLYTLVFAFGLVNLWRGVWQLLDVYFTNSWLSGTGSTVVGCWALASLRTLRNIAAPPVVVNTDIMDDEYTHSPTMFQTYSKRSTWYFLLDVAFSVIVVGSLVVFVWRGIWTVMDRLLFPDEISLSCWASVAIGFFVVLLSYLLQRPFASASKKFYFSISRVLFEDLFYLFASFGAISLWRGVWMFADIYVCPEDREFSNWLTMMFGLLGSLLLGAGNTLLARGVYIDGAIKDGSGCFFSTQFLRKFFKDDTELVMTRKDDVGDSRIPPMENSPASKKLLKGENHQMNVVIEVIVERETVL